MSIPVMLALSMSMSLFGSVSRKLFAQNTTGSAAGIFWLSSICSVMSMLVLVLMVCSLASCSGYVGIGGGDVVMRYGD